MIEHVFPHSRLSRRRLMLRLAVVGAAGALALGLVSALLGAQVLGWVSSDVRVTVRLVTTGDTLGINSDVKYQGLRVGRVVRVDPGVGESDDSGPSAVALIMSEHVERIPDTVRARVLPGTLFGNEYIDLVQPRSRGEITPAAAAGPAAHLVDGDVVPADASRRTVRLMQTLASTQRLLAAVDPARLDVALSQLASTLDRRGDDLATFVEDADAFLGRWERLRPQVTRDLELLTDNADLFDDLEPQVVSALRDSLPLARTWVNRHQQLTALLRGATRLLGGPRGVTRFLRLTSGRTIRMLRASAATLDAFARRHPSFELLISKVPRLLHNGANAVKNGRIQMEGVMSTRMLDPYDAHDCPRYRDLPGRNCPVGGAR